MSKKELYSKCGKLGVIVKTWSQKRTNLSWIWVEKAIHNNAIPRKNLTTASIINWHIRRREKNRAKVKEE